MADEPTNEPGEGGAEDVAAQAEAAKQEAAEAKARLAEYEARMNDPNYVKTLNDQMNPAQEPPAQAPELKLPEEPKFGEINPDLTGAQLAQEMERRNDAKLKWMQDCNRLENEHKEKLNALEREKQQSQQASEQAFKAKQEEIAQIDAFCNEHEDIEAYKPAIKEIYGKRIDIEFAYNYAKWQQLAKEAEASGGGFPRPAMKASSSRDPKTLNKKIESVEDGAKLAIDEQARELGSAFDEYFPGP